MWGGGGGGPGRQGKRVSRNRKSRRRGGIKGSLVKLKEEKEGKQVGGSWTGVGPGKESVGS